MKYKEPVKKCWSCGTLQQVNTQAVIDHGCSICKCPRPLILSGDRRKKPRE